MTQLEVITSVTDTFLQTHTLNTIEETKDARNILLDETNREYDIRNQTEADSKNRWKHEKDITPYQVAAIILSSFTVKNIEMVDDSEENTILEIYIDDTVIEIVGEWCRKYYGTYRKETKILNAVIDCVNRGMEPANKNKVKSFLSDMADSVKRTIDENLIPVCNGIFDYKLKTLYNFSPEYVFISKAAINYNPLATNPHFILSDGMDWDFDSWIYDLPDYKDCVELLRVQVPIALLRHNKNYRHAVFLKGNAGCGGKGSMIHLWRNLLGEGNHCSITLDNLNKEFYLEPLLRTTAILNDETPVGMYIEKSDVFKCIVTADKISVNRKNKDIVNFTFHGCFVNSLNEIPKIKDKSESLFRRQIFVPMNKNFIGHILLVDGSLMYSIILKTSHSFEAVTNVYYFYDEMMSDDLSWLIGEILNDFTELINESCRLKRHYCEESFWEKSPCLPHKNGILCCERRKDLLLKERHFYDGQVTNYGVRKTFPWKTWENEIFKKFEEKDGD